MITFLHPLYHVIQCVQRYYGPSFQEGEKKDFPETVRLLIEALISFYCFGVKYYQNSNLSVSCHFDSPQAFTVLIQDEGQKKTLVGEGSLDSEMPNGFYHFFCLFQAAFKRCFIAGGGEISAEQKRYLMDLARVSIVGSSFDELTFLHRFMYLLDQIDLVHLMLLAKRDLMQVGGVCRVSIDQMEITLPNLKTVN